MIKNAPFVVTVDGGDAYELHPETAQQLDIVEVSDGKFQILNDGKSFEAELVVVNREKRLYVFRSGGEIFSLKIEDHYERLVKQLGLTAGGAPKMNVVKAPMPGLVLAVPVVAGDHVSKGDILVILEAMKMENVIKSAGDGVVKTVKVQQGTAVEKGQLLIELE